MSYEYKDEIIMNLKDYNAGRRVMHGGTRAFESKIAELDHVYSIAESYDAIKFIDINMTKKLIPKQALVNAMHTLPPKEVQEAAEIDYIKHVKENMARDIGIAALEEGKIEFETMDYHSLGETLRGSVVVLSLKELKEMYRYMERLELKLRLEESR